MLYVFLFLAITVLPFFQFLYFSLLVSSTRNLETDKFKNSTIMSHFGFNFQENGLENHVIIVTSSF